MCCFGPNLWLAQALLKAGYHDDVVTFLEGIKKFWTMDNGALDGWIADISRGLVPDMRPNNRVDARN